MSIEDDEAGDDFSDEPPIVPIASDIERAIEILSQLTLFSDKGEEMRAFIKKILYTISKSYKTFIFRIQT